jgi:hypothetical protein
LTSDAYEALRWLQREHRLVSKEWSLRHPVLLDIWPDDSFKRQGVPSGIALGYSSMGVLIDRCGWLSMARHRARRSRLG